ncbi:MAG: Dabb family protein [Actinomycetota bacterium]|nr:Dabb family protein [Actinomycetota bacterium]MDA8208938.1 Dabb family protein [Actinomycetota bacterium]
MVRHIALFRFRPDLSEAELAGIAAAVEEFLSGYRGLVQAVHGSDLKLREGNFDYAVSVDFETTEDYLAYASDPVHLEMIAKHLAPNMVARSALQLEY